MAVGVPILALALVIAAFLVTTRDADTAEGWVHHTEEVQAAIGETQNVLTEAETGVRGYLLSGDRTWLAPYERARQRVGGSVDRLASLTADNEQQVARVGELRDLAARRLMILDELVAMGGAGRGLDDAGMRLLAEGKSVADALRSLLATMADEESALLAERRALADEATGRSTALVLGVGLAGLVGGVAGAFLLATGVITRIARLRENARRLVDREAALPLAPARDEIGLLSEALAQAGALLAERETALAEARAFLEHLIATGPVLMFRVELPSQATTYMSPNVTAITGYEPGEILADPDWWRKHVDPGDLDAVLSKLAGVAKAGGGTVESEWRLRTKSGEAIWLYNVSRIQYGEDGAPSGALAYAIDVTERKRAEAEREAARAEAEKANRAKSEFLSRMSHELRTPLNSVIGFSQLLEMDGLSDPQRDSVRYIRRAGSHLLDLINEVLDIARIETGRLPLSPEPVLVPELVDEAVGLLRPAAEGRQITIEEVRSCEAHVRADRQRLKQVMLNLLSNAIKYNRDGGSVSVSCEPVADRVRITVRDTGPGISAEGMGRLFTPFERLGAEQSAVDGIGIGLALSKALTELMGGTIGVESRVGEGSTFWIELERVEAPLARLVSPASDESGHARSDRRRILHIEDNAANLKLIEHVLARRPGIELESAMQGRLGLELARVGKPDLVLLDLHLPDMPGGDVLVQLRGDPATRDLPVVVISADATPGQQRRWLAEGARAYITKPIDVPAFLALLDALWTETPGARPVAEGVPA